MIGALRMVDSSLNPESWILNPRLRKNADLSKTNWFRVGGPAQWLFRPEDVNDLSVFLSQLPRDIPVTILGVGSNVIVRDGGIDGVVIKLGRGFTQMSTLSPRERGGASLGEGVSNRRGPHPNLLPEGEGIEAGAACLDLNVAQFACENALAGLEFLSGIPGTIGGAVRMNGGAYGSDTSQILVEAEMVERDGKIRVLGNQACGFSYRYSSLPEGAIVTKAVFKVQMGDKEAIAKKNARHYACARGNSARALAHRWQYI